MPVREFCTHTHRPENSFRSSARPQKRPPKSLSSGEHHGSPITRAKLAAETTPNAVTTVSELNEKGNGANGLSVDATPAAAGDNVALNFSLTGETSNHPLLSPEEQQLVQTVVLDGLRNSAHLRGEQQQQQQQQQQQPGNGPPIRLDDDAAFASVAVSGGTAAADGAAGPTTASASALNTYCYAYEPADFGRIPVKLAPKICGRIYDIQPTTVLVRASAQERDKPDAPLEHVIVQVHLGPPSRKIQPEYRPIGEAACADTCSSKKLTAVVIAGDMSVRLPQLHFEHGSWTPADASRPNHYTFRLKTPRMCSALEEGGSTLCQRGQRAEGVPLRIYNDDDDRRVCDIDAAPVRRIFGRHVDAAERKYGSGTWGITETLAKLLARLRPIPLPQLLATAADGADPAVAVPATAPAVANTSSAVATTGQGTATPPCPVIVTTDGPAVLTPATLEPIVVTTAAICPPAVPAHTSVADVKHQTAEAGLAVVSSSVDPHGPGELTLPVSALVSSDGERPADSSSGRRGASAAAATDVTTGTTTTTTHTKAEAAPANEYTVHSGARPKQSQGTKFQGAQSRDTKPPAVVELSFSNLPRGSPPVARYFPPCPAPQTSRGWQHQGGPALQGGPGLHGGPGAHEQRASEFFPYGTTYPNGFYYDTSINYPTARCTLVPAPPPGYHYYEPGVPTYYNGYPGAGASCGTRPGIPGPSGNYHHQGQVHGTYRGHLPQALDNSPSPDSLSHAYKDVDPNYYRELWQYLNSNDDEQYRISLPPSSQEIVESESQRDEREHREHVARIIRFLDDDEVPGPVPDSVPEPVPDAVAVEEVTTEETEEANSQPESARALVEIGRSAPTF